MKKILVIDDSTLMRRVISDIINQTNEYCVAYMAKNGVEGLEYIENNNDILGVFCDINMPKMSGLELLQILKRRNIHIPVVMISSSDDVNDTITALQLGALEFIKKPQQVLTVGKESFEKRVNNALCILNNGKNLRDIKMPNGVISRTNSNTAQAQESNHSKLIALVCSTGGPRALQSVLPFIPENINAPIVLVQHMPAGFTKSLADRLNDLSRIQVKEAENDEILKKGVCYIAKGGYHLTVKRDGKTSKICLDDSPAVMGLKPCGNIMYESLSKTDYAEIICVVLTGMGEDGAKGIMNLSRTKNIYVIAQDEETSTVYGMPRAVYQRGLTDSVCSIDKIAEEITRKVGVL